MLGVGNGESFIASDVPALLAYTRECMYIEQGELCVLTQEGITIKNHALEVIDKEIHTIEWDAEAAPSNVAIMGRYIITPAIFGILERTAPGAGNEIQLTDALKTLALKEKMLAYAFKGRRHDVGDKLGFLQATVEFALQRDNLRDDFLHYLEGIVKQHKHHI